MSRLVADIGATNSRLLWQEDGPILARSYLNADFPDLYQVISRFLDEVRRAGDTIDRVVLALPAPVESQPVRLTNIDWQVDSAVLQKQFPVQDVILVNDFQAAAIGAIRQAGARRLNPHGHERHPPRGPAVVTGAGTGLGLAWFADVAQPGLPQATEGGHADFPPQDAQQRELHAWLEARYGHVSAERILSGEGLATLYEFLGGTRRRPVEVSSAAAAGEARASEAARLFVRIFGAYAGNLALMFNPRGGIYLCGGVVAHLANWFGDDFLHAFLDKGRMQPFVERIPVHLHADHDLGLQGALHIAMQE